MDGGLIEDRKWTHVANFLYNIKNILVLILGIR